MESLYAASAYIYRGFQNHPYPLRFMLYVYRIMVYIICIMPDAFSTDLYPIFVDNVNKSVDNPQLSTILLFISILLHSFPVLLLALFCPEFFSFSIGGHGNP